MDAKRYMLANAAEIASPALIYYEDIICKNTRDTIRIAGGADRLWPHMKSHKMAEMLKMQREAGICRVKCATIAELKLAAQCGMEHALLAYPLLGPAVENFLDVMQQYPATHFYALGDNYDALYALNAAAVRRGAKVDWLADVNMGMDRTGVQIAELAAFVEKCAGLAGLNFAGLHCYDGQIHDTDAAERNAKVAAIMDRVNAARAELNAHGIAGEIVIAGGSPTFPCHALENGVFLSPGTVFVWDHGYATNFPDLPFEAGAAVLTRVISLPAEGVFTLDLGYKGIASDPAGARGQLLGVDNCEPMFQSEEHWTWHMLPGHESERPEIGAVLYVIPTHICPTSALYRAVWVERGGEAHERWEVAARNRD